MLALLFSSLLTGCLVSAPLPDVGPCADYPEGIYEYGLIGIGSCIAGPTDIAFVEGADGELSVLVTNANPYKIFSGGSLLSIPWSSIDLTQGRNLVSDLPVSTLDLPDFAGPIAVIPEQDLALVGVRLSAEGRTRVYDDQVHLIDISDPTALAFSDRGTNGNATVTVESDPIGIAYDRETGLAFVANRTDHTISVLDTTGSEIKVISPWPTYAISSAQFTDTDASGSTAELADLEGLDESLLRDETWTLTWLEGTWRLWRTDDDGALHRLTTTGGDRYTPSGIGAELDPADYSDLTAVSDPFFLYTASGQMFYADAGDILTSISAAWLGDWTTPDAALVARDDEVLGGPAVVQSSNIYWMFFDATEGGNPAEIRLALSDDALTFNRQSGTIITPGRAHDAAGVSQPHVTYDRQLAQWRMYYSAFDGTRWTIGLAISDDLATWVVDETPILALDGEDVGGPAVSIEAGAYRMWFSRGDGAGGWTTAYAESVDGLHWTVLDDIDDTVQIADKPPRAALQVAPTAAFRIAGANTGTLSAQLTPGQLTGVVDYGWATTALAGAWLTTGDAGAASAGGLRVDSVDADGGRAWMTLTSSGGVQRIARADLDAEGIVQPDAAVVLEGSGGGFDASGVSSPVVWQADDGTWRMIYAGDNGTVTRLGVATSDDGEAWDRVGKLQDNGDSWDSFAAIPGSIQRTGSGQWRLWYSGYDGTTWRIGALVSANDGQTWSPEAETPLFSPGAPGDWDDSGVRDPYLIADDAGVLTGEPGEHLWYAGFDGDTWRLGHAFRAVGTGTWSRAEDPATEEPRAVLDEVGGLFHPSGAWRPVVSLEAGGGVSLWFSGLYNETERVGRAVGRAPDRLLKAPRRPTVGDTLVFETQRGDADVKAIPLDNEILGISLTGIGLTGLDIDAERGFLYASSKLLPYIAVIDIRDDSTPTFTDLNYLDVEAVMLAKSFSGETGFRQVLPVPGSDLLYGISDSPESIMLLDGGLLVDDAYADLLYDTQVGYLLAPASSQDEGVLSRSAVGPARLAIHPDGQRLFVTNFNANSIGAYDLELGPYGTPVAEVPDVGENPYAIAISPDGNYAIFGNYSGEAVPGGLTESTLAVLDIDPDSPTYLSVLTWITNR